MITAPVPPTVTVQLLSTSGALQLVVTECPNCGQAHRHLALGLRRSACGFLYVLQLPPATALTAVA